MRRLEKLLNATVAKIYLENNKFHFYIHNYCPLYPQLFFHPLIMHIFIWILSSENNGETIAQKGGKPYLDIISCVFTFIHTESLFLYLPLRHCHCIFSRILIPHDSKVFILLCNKQKAKFNC